MKRSLLLFSHQLHPTYLEVAQTQGKIDEIVLIDSNDQWQYYRYHQQRILLHLSAMHHYQAFYSKQGLKIRILKSKSFLSIYQSLDHVLVFRPTNFYEQAWIQQHPHVTILEDPLFLIPATQWSTLLPNHKSWKLDPLYRQFRQQFNILMQGNAPEGGQYSYDQENRKGPSKDLQFIPPIWFTPDAMTLALSKDVARRFSDHPGTCQDFAYPVTREDALKGLKYFLNHRLSTFGDHQDAMLTDQPWMSHSLISSSINLGLLGPLEVIKAAEKIYRQGKAPLAATEGFIRQILGWREYVRGVYLSLGPSYLTVNHFHHRQPLPAFFYTGQTSMHCLSTTIQETIAHAYNHHIQRLMVLSNYANLAEVTPQALNQWFNEMYIDSSEWVVAANVLGMGLHADGGKMATKPYIASGAYLDKMSDYCDHCQYQVTLKTGDKACPFNSLYWHYIASKKSQLEKNPRMGMMVKVFEKMPKDQQAALLTQAKKHLASPK
ncbi:MAG: cryptochrome/photolyase family protein [Bacilli bacterium]